MPSLMEQYDVGSIYCHQRTLYFIYYDIVPLNIQYYTDTCITHTYIGGSSICHMGPQPIFWPFLPENLMNMNRFEPRFIGSPCAALNLSTTHTHTVISNYRQTWRPNQWMRWLVLYIAGGVYEQITLWNNVRVDDWTAELAIVASNETQTQRQTQVIRKTATYNNNAQVTNHAKKKIHPGIEATTDVTSKSKIAVSTKNL